MDLRPVQGVPRFTHRSLEIDTSPTVIWRREAGKEDGWMESHVLCLVFTILSLFYQLFF